MFGGLTFLLSGNMLCCISEKGLMAQVGAAAEPAALAKPHAAPCLGAGRRVHPGGATRVACGCELEGWLGLALAYVEQLPPKKAKPPRRR
jgi:hypothetical protein